VGSTLNGASETAGGSVLRVGVIGVGNISKQYFAEFPKLPNLELVVVADLDLARAAEVAAEQGVRSSSVDELLADPEVDVVLNLTIPAAHADVALRALEAGKHVYGEKPLALSTAEARPVLDSGAIGRPIAAAVAWSAPGHELWHPAPAFYYQPGGGPLLDMGPYYLTSLVSFFGPVVRVSGAVARSDRERSVATGALAGTPIPVHEEVDTHVTAILEHANGVVSTVTVSFEVWASRVPLFEVYGTGGTVAVPDPNRFSDPVEIATAGDRTWRAVPDSAGFVDAGRGVGLSDLAEAIEQDRPHRASGDLAFHVLEIMEAIIVAGREHRVVELTSTVPRPAPVARELSLRHSSSRSD
jgi:predicted dehydrogenase